jgi:hypothetical protein
MNEEARFDFYEIKKCGYYNSKGPACEFGEFDQILKNL